MTRVNIDCLFLYELLMEKSIEHQTFETISKIVQNRYPKYEYLTVGTLLTGLICHGDLPGVIQKLSAYYIIYDLFKSDGQNETPFVTYFLKTIEAKDPTSLKVNLIERNFISQLLAHGTKDLAKQTPYHMLQQELVQLPIDLSSLMINNEKQSELLPVTVKSSIMNMISASSVPTLNETSAKDLMDGLQQNNTPLKNHIAPHFMTVGPPLLPVDDELIWLDFTNPVWHKPIYDSTLLSSTNTVSQEAKRLIENAFNESLNIQDRKLFISELEKDPDLVNHIGLTPEKLPELVENNPLIAIEILLKLMNSPQITEYFNVLVNMEMSLYSMEVVNRLTTSVDLPTEFVYLYISNCISTCENIKDRYVQTRLVRLLCVFLQSLIRNKIINVRESFPEVEAFCIEFSRIREAAGLYRLLRQVIGGDNIVGSASITASTTSTTAAAPSTSAAIIKPSTESKD